MRRSLASAGFPAVLEPAGLDRGDGKRPDGLTIFPFRDGKCLTWDVTCVDTFADTVLVQSALNPGTAARLAEERKRQRYSELARRYIFEPVALETSGVYGPSAAALVQDLGRRISAQTGDRRETAWLRQRLSIAIARGNAVSILATAPYTGSEATHKTSPTAQSGFTVQPQTGQKALQRAQERQVVHGTAELEVTARREEDQRSRPNVEFCKMAPEEEVARWKRTAEQESHERKRRSEQGHGVSHHGPPLDDGAGIGRRPERSHSSPLIVEPGNEQVGAPTSELAPPVFSRETQPRAGNQSAEVQNSSRSAPSIGPTTPALIGLKNFGNICYMNAVVQCVNSTPGLSEFLVHLDCTSYSGEPTHGETVQELAAIVKALWSGRHKSESLHDLKNAMGRRHACFRDSAQQDAHEFLLCLLNSLHEELTDVSRKQMLREQGNDGVPDSRAIKLLQDDSQSSSQSPISNLFGGQYKSTLRCVSCGNQSAKFEAFSHLSVPMPARASQCSLHECIQLFVEGDTISGWTCPECQSSDGATKRLDIRRLPPVLIIHIQRFYNDGAWKKNQSSVLFPLKNLDMSPHLATEDAHQQHHRYHLYGVVNHYGSMDSGHYTAFCRAPNTDRWHKYDDHQVHELSGGSVQSSAGYLLFYSAIDQRL
ncbi:Ubiquitin carboxyl-terminal hydrolase 8 [Amphibalanus amphitrite]|uniref:Ubiquitin carboxyl-terminal hydrolase n=1 Tax=Amphibalanus amphitrite TaxID=1232801 RepID=A0A6A4VWA3_AMPAM|nr:Ubiquitin carboxyl-terminal hydrolase 8 [Amphibalanus amphitrite]